MKRWWFTYALVCWSGALATLFSGDEWLSSAHGMESVAKLDTAASDPFQPAVAPLATVHKLRQWVWGITDGDVDDCKSRTIEDREWRGHVGTPPYPFFTRSFPCLS
jgi:hypothetical protein